MKRQHITRLSILILILTSLSCKKLPFDYRNKYIGDYNFVHSYSSWTVNQGTYASGTDNYSGRVYYDLKSKEYIKFEYNNSILELKVSRKGKLTLPCGAPAGEFTSDNSVTINYSTSTCSGALGGGTNISVTGTKK